MTKEEFDKLDINGKILYLNKELKEGKTVIRIREDIGISEKSLQKEIRDGGYRYSQKIRQYISTTENTTIPTTQKNELSVVEKSTSVVSKQKLKVLDYLEENFSILEAFIERYKTTTTTTTETTTNKIVINLVDDKHLSPKPKSIRINEFVYKDWQQFCEENKYYSKQDLISMALKEYILKYSN